MELNCPSCATKHQTEDYKGDFEIVCKCGYSILIPDEDAIERQNNPPPPQAFDTTHGETPDSPMFSPEPSTVEAQDEAFIVTGQGLEPEAQEIPASDEVVFIPESMTPPEQLPEGMPYDPLEVPNPLPTSSSESLEIDIPPFPNPMDEPSLPNPTALSVSPEEAAPAAKAPKVSRGKSKPVPQTAAPLTPAKALVEKSIRSSLGQILGFSYNLKVSGLDATQVKNLKLLTSEFCHFRPWLGDELKKRNIIIDEMTWEDWIANLPEPLAVEIYLKTMELGGHCEFQLST